MPVVSVTERFEILGQGHAQVVTSSVNIYKAMGGGWITQADGMTGTTPAAPPPSGLPPPLF